MAEEIHPSQETLRRFARVKASRRENRQVVAHLLRGCRSCSALVVSGIESSHESPLETPLEARLGGGEILGFTPRGTSPAAPESLASRLPAPRRVI